MKIIVVGEMGVGKSCLVRRYVEGLYSEFYRATIGVDFASKAVQLGDRLVTLQLWDIAGQERFGQLTGLYYRESVGALVVFDVTKASSFDAAPRWKADINEKCVDSMGNPIPALLLGNKVDLVADVDADWEERKKGLCSAAERHGFLGLFFTSARTGDNVEEAVLALVRHIVENAIRPEAAGEGGVDLTALRGGPSRCC